MTLHLNFEMKFISSIIIINLKLTHPIYTKQDPFPIHTKTSISTMHATKTSFVVVSTLLSLAVARPMPTPQMLNTPVGETNIWTQLQGAPILPRMAQMLPRVAQMLNGQVNPNGDMWTEAHGGQPVTATATESTTVSQIRRMIDARWW